MFQENEENTPSNTDCQAEVWEPDVSLETGDKVAHSPTRENSESSDGNAKEEYTQVEQSETEELNQREVDDNQTEIEEADSCENVLQIEEKMNELEEERFANEPFSLDLCSVRLQCESDLYPAPAAALLPPPANQLTDDDQWTDSNSEAR